MPAALKNEKDGTLETINSFNELGTRLESYSGKQKEQVRKQIGMAVPPEGAKIIFEAILKTFAGVEYKSVNTSYRYDPIGSNSI